MLLVIRQRLSKLLKQFGEESIPGRVCFSAAFGASQGLANRRRTHSPELRCKLGYCRISLMTQEVQHCQPCFIAVLTGLVECVVVDTQMGTNRVYDLLLARPPLQLLPLRNLANTWTSG